MFLGVKSSKCVVVVSALILSSFLMVTVSSAGTLATPTVVISALGSTSASQSGCLTKYEAGPPALGSTQMTVTFTNYTQGAQVRFRISGPSGSWVTHLIDYVSSPEQCNNMIETSGSWFPVTIPSGSTSLTIIGLPGSLLDVGGYFQSLYVEGASSSVVTSTAVPQDASPTPTLPPVVTTTTAPDSTSTEVPIVGLTCSTYVFIGAPGSGENQSSSDLGETLTNIYQAIASSPKFAGKMSSLSLLAGGTIVYSAAGVPKLTASDTSWSSYLTGMMVPALTDVTFIERAISECPRSQFILAGYSQGAAVLHEMLATIANDSSLSGDAASLSDHVLGVLLVADPYATSSDLKIVGSGDPNDWKTNDEGIMPLTKALMTQGDGPNFAWYTALRTADPIAWTLCKVSSSSLLCQIKNAISKILSLQTMGLGGDYNYAQEEGYFTSSSQIAAALQTHIYSVSKVGDLVADPEGFVGSCVVVLKCPTGNWFSISVHKYAYEDDTTLHKNIADTFAKLTPGPVIDSVSAISDSVSQTITITGSGFGDLSPYADNNSPYIRISDDSDNDWQACYNGPGSRDSVTCSISRWTGSSIVITRFGSNYGEGIWKFEPGDQLTVSVWNPQTLSGPGTCQVTVR